MHLAAATMNNSSDSNSAFPFNFSAAMDGSASTYCQNVSAPSASPSQGSTSNNVDQSSNHTGQQLPQQQQQLGGGNMSNNMKLVQSLFQSSQQQSSSPASSAAGASSSAPGASQAAVQHAWQSCRFCQQKFYVTSERLLEHEISCPMHLQVQQFLQQQQRQQQQNELQHQLQMQQNQLQQQFKVQQAQQMDSYNLSNVFSGSMGQYMSGNPFQQSNDLQAAQASQHQALNSLLQQPQQQINTALMEQQPYHQASAQSNSSYNNQASTSNTNEDQFQSAINSLPAFEPKPLSSSFTSNIGKDKSSSTKDYFPLAMPEDEEWLTPLHCFVRRYCVEIFVATPEDVAAPCMGKRNPVSVHQVGIRCPYCSPERMENRQQAVDVARARENGVVYPSLITRIYNSSINLLQRHLRSCAFVPPEILARYEELKSSNARSGASKKYWADSALRLGLADTPDGIRLDREAHKAHLAAQASGGGKSSDSPAAPEAPPLVLPSDKRNTTAFTFHLMSQMQPCVFTEADRLGRRRGLKVGFAGLACRHCFGVYGSGRFFPSSVKTMADASKTLDVIYRHVMKCKNCPGDIKGGLSNLRDFHDSERSKMPFGNQRAFFVKIWGRLHESSADFQALPPPVPSPTVASSAATATTPQKVPSTKAPTNSAESKLNVATTPNGESLHGLYAMVKRRDSDCDQAHNKLTTEAA